MKPKQHIDKIRKIIWREYKQKAQNLKIKSKSSFTPSYTIKPKQKGLATSRQVGTQMSDLEIK